MQMEADEDAGDAHPGMYVPPTHTQCVKCKQDNTFCVLSYPRFCHEHLVMKKLPGHKEETCTMCCRCIFKHAYKGRNALAACNCKRVFYGTQEKKK